MRVQGLSEKSGSEPKVVEADLPAATQTVQKIIDTVEELEAEELGAGLKALDAALSVLFDRTCD